MSKKLILIAFFAIVSSGLFSQSPAFELNFTAIDSAAYVQLDSIRVINRTQGGDTLLYWPDTVLSINYVGIPGISIGENSFRVFQNYPNPVAEQTIISLFIPEKDNVSLIVTDQLGRLILKAERPLDDGIHSFRFIPGNTNLYFFTAQWRRQTSCIKILQASSNSTCVCSLEYVGSELSFPQYKATEDIQTFSFSPGDSLLCIGYATGLQSGILCVPETSENYTFQFATNIPCPGTSTVTYQGQVYNTIQVFSQCWLKENLNVGTMLQDNQDMTDNGIMEKYCYNNQPDSCTKYGGLYVWNEMMQYTTVQGAQGICPPGWHLTTDEEWKVLEGAVDTKYGIGDPEWDLYLEMRGYDAGVNLKTTTGWNNEGNGIDLYSFSGLPAGVLYSSGFFFAGSRGYWWTSTPTFVFAWARFLDSNSIEISRGYNLRSDSFSARCLKDY